MSKKKIILSMMSFIFAIALMVIPNKVQASTTLSTPLYFGVQEFRSGTTPDNLGYAIKDPEASGTSGELVGAKIWQIVKYNSSSATGNYTTGNYYCVRAGIGFNDITKSATYNISYDLKSDRDELISSSTNQWVRTVATNGYFDNLLALTDILYLPGESTNYERKTLLENAGIYEEDYNYGITDSDIEAVQQAVIWYYTNHDDVSFNSVYNNYDKESWLFYRTLAMSQNDVRYTSFSDYIDFDSNGDQTGPGLERQEQAVLLYRYLIDTANANASAYANGTAVSKTKVTLYTNSTVADTQPVILIEKLLEEKEFDLSLRKYITKVDGTEVTNTRVPNIDESTIETEKTATYKHRKDPVVVKNGNVVTYKLTVYNEGEKAGRATQIIDQLPTGLKFKRVVSGNFDGSYDETTNVLTLNRKSGNTDNLSAYVQNDLDSETIEIECEVIAVASETQDTILTNVAWISEEYDAEDDIVITNQEGKDRDSTPSNSPSVNKDNMSDYAGSSNYANLADSTYYFKGQEDDDDFEKLILEKENLENSYNVILVKEDAYGEQLDSTATFVVNGVTKTVTGRLTIAEDVIINQENVNVQDTYTIKETVAPDEYCKFDGTINIKVTKKFENGEYKVDSIEYTVTDEEGNDITTESRETADVYLNENGNIYVEVKNYQFDLKLVKRIVEVNGVKVPERINGVDITKLADGTATTADYDLTETPVFVKSGDIVKYTLRVYNEGQIDGYATEISEDIPEGLEFVWSEKTEDELDADNTISDVEKEAIIYNQGIWTIKDVDRETNKAKVLTTDYLAKGKGAEIRNDGANLIKAFDKTKEYTNLVNDKNPDYKEVSVYLRVIAKNTYTEVIRNEAAITEDTDSKGNPVDDRDSDTELWKEHPDHEDDEDHDYIQLKSFDLALRKFITNVNEEEVTTRIPEIKYDSENNKITYEHTKDPVDVVTDDIVIYTIRVYNEGQIDGYASKISDDIPDGLEYLPNNELNKEFRWVMYDKDGKQTTDVSKAIKITTDYLSKEQGKIRMANNEELTENPALLTAFDKDAEISETNPDYADVQVAFKVIEPNGSSRILINSAQISDDTDSEGKPVDDIDSIPDEWNEGEDDQDREYVKLRYFDLALRKWVTHAIIVENGKESVIQTGHKAEDDPEDIVKVELNRKKLSTLQVKFRYSIRVTNEGDLAGYAKEITDYIPEGLKFVAADNSGWTDEGNNVISTRKLENTLLEPGESAEVQVTLTWINGTNTLGLKINTAEISEDYNEKHAKDRDSTPDNQKEGEDDIDDAPVILSIKTGKGQVYLVLGLAVLITLGTGIVLIKKFVL